MEIGVVVKTGKNGASNERDVRRTFKKALQIAKRLGGTIVGGRGRADGTEIVVLL